MKYNPYFGKPIDKETRKILWKLAGRARINALKYRNKRTPEQKLKGLLMKHFDSKCFWCDVEVTDFISPGVRPPFNTATIDHVVSRYFRKKGDDVLKVLACNRCNQARARYENGKYGAAYNQKRAIEQLHATNPS